MQKGLVLEFHCITCKAPIHFSVFELEKKEDPIPCTRCGKQYLLQDKNLKRQLKKFEALCCQIRDSEEILNNTVVAINVGTHQVEVPYKLLLTRLNSKLTLKIGEEQISIAFRLEPIHDAPPTNSSTTQNDKSKTQNPVAIAGK